MNFAGIGGPRIGRIEVEIPGLIILFPSPISQLARLKNTHMRFVLAPADAIVFLAACPAESQGKQGLLGRRARGEPLPIDRNIAVLLIANGCIDRIAAADELVQAEGEGRESGLWDFAGVPGQQTSLNCLHTANFGKTRDAAQFPGCALLAGD